MDMTDYFRFIAAFALVLALMWGLALLLRRLNARNILPGMPQKRLNVIEIRGIDTRHRLALVACDDQEHLVVLGPNGATHLQTAPTPQTMPNHTNNHTANQAGSHKG